MLKNATISWLCNAHTIYLLWVLLINLPHIKLKMPVYAIELPGPSSYIGNSPGGPKFKNARKIRTYLHDAIHVMGEKN